MKNIKIKIKAKMNSNMEFDYAEIYIGGELRWRAKNSTTHLMGIEKYGVPIKKVNEILNYLLDLPAYIQHRVTLFEWGFIFQACKKGDRVRFYLPYSTLCSYDYAKDHMISAFTGVDLQKKEGSTYKFIPGNGKVKSEWVSEEHPNGENVFYATNGARHKLKIIINDND